MHVFFLSDHSLSRSLSLSLSFSRSLAVLFVSFQSRSIVDALITETQTCISDAVVVGYYQQSPLLRCIKKIDFIGEKSRTARMNLESLARGTNIEACNVMGCERGFRSETQLCTASCYALSHRSLCAPLYCCFFVFVFLSNMVK